MFEILFKEIAAVVYQVYGKLCGLLSKYFRTDESVNYVVVYI